MNQEYLKPLFLTENDSHVTLPSNLPAFYSIEASFGLVFRYYLDPYQPEIVWNIIYIQYAHGQVRIQS